MRQEYRTMSLGGKTTQTQQIDPDLKAAALANLEMAQRVGRLGFVPYKGATVAGFQPAQIGAMQNTNTGLEAFGLSGSQIPPAGDLSPFAIYQEQLSQMAPGQRAFIESMFINPMTGMMPGAAAGAEINPAQAAMMRERGGRDGSGGAASSGAGGGYNGIRDMIDGGGPGRSGTSFSGGGRVSAAANRAGISPAEGRGKNAGGPGRTSTYGK
jgi:hypothetical protein